MLELFEKTNNYIEVSILNDDLKEFESKYKKNLVLDDKKLLLFCMENGALDIVACLLKNYKNEFNRLSSEEKILFFYYVLRTKYLNNNNQLRYNIYHYCFNQYSIGKKLHSTLLLNILKYGTKELLTILPEKTTLNNKEVINLLYWIKNNVLTKEQKDNIINELIGKIKEQKNSGIYSLLSLSVGNDLNYYCMEIDIFDSLSDKYQSQWINYLMSANNLDFHLHQNYLEALKKNGSNILDLNIDFMFFINNIILPNIMDRVDKKQIESLIRFKINIEKDLNNRAICNELVNSINSIVLRYKLNNQLENKNKIKGKNKI